MGTTFTVKIFDPPEFAEDPAFLVDQLLRRVNDQMSTYLENSEISRFNRSNSTEWFPVSDELASVVAFSQLVAEKTGGAFDVTVGPLVNAWNFGPDRAERAVPDGEVIKRLRESVGFRKLSVRVDPPALRKSVAGLKLDLSAVAKGYAVDRVVALLNDQDAEDLFVEIGGEVSVSGNKAGQWWKVGIQMPDAATDSVLIAHSLNVGGGNDRSMATSGDYRNYFEVDGTRYSHTIDPRSGMPIEHSLASVTVVTDFCMAADAWATALNVLGPEKALQAAKAEGLDVLLVARDQSEASGYQLAANGSLNQYITAEETSAESGVPEEQGNGRFTMFVVTAVAFALLLFAMSVGVLFGQRSISGSCGGVNGTKNEDGSVSCSLCSSPSDACRDLRKRMNEKSENEMVDV
ncbi:MAG: thiamine biosynthesis protein ApbE [Rhodopirellula sp.]|nr:thiamine biosynthesis protein ApbE [Rhodopirellula sp.]